MEFRYAERFGRENLELVIYSMTVFFVPFLIGHPQLLVGTIVNAGLVLAGLNLRGYKVFGVAVMPSLAVLSRGIIFGPFTFFILYMIPFIWIGNIAYAYSFNLIKNRIAALIAGTIVKVSLLFAVALLLVKIGILPAIFLSAMGLMQLYTAIAGGVLALGINKIKN